MIPRPGGRSAVDTTNISASVHNYIGVDRHGRASRIEGSTTSSSGSPPAWACPTGAASTASGTPSRRRWPRPAATRPTRTPTLWGGAWWQWRQSCGDPHAVQWSGGRGRRARPAPSTHLNLLGCPGNVDLGPNDAFLDILGRGYPRATPGRLVQLRSDPAPALMKVEATAAEAGGELVVWTPTADDADHRVHVLGLTDVVEHAVAGGRIITATVAAAGAYALWIGPIDEDLAAPGTHRSGHARTGGARWPAPPTHRLAFAQCPA